MEKNKPLVEDIKKIQACRNCQNNNLKHILSIGNQYLVDFLEEDGENFTAPLELVLCDPETNGCGLLQLHHTLGQHSVIFIVSDYISPSFLRPLKFLKNRHDVILINLSDIRESELPDIGYTMLEDMESGEQLLVNTSDTNFR